MVGFSRDGGAGLRDGEVLVCEANNDSGQHGGKVLIAVEKLERVYFIIFLFSFS